MVIEIRPPGGGIPDVPDVSAEWYRAVVSAVDRWPGWLQELVAAGTDAGLLLFAVALAALWWRARTRGADAMARALAACAAPVAAYAVSELAKLVKAVDRPCRLLPDVHAIEECPAAGDWSLPSNHAAIAGAAAVGLWWAAGYVAGVLGLAAALCVAASRVAVGAHFPHDVVAGLLVGVVVAAAAAPLLTRAARPMVEAWRRRSEGALLLGPGPRG